MKYFEKHIVKMKKVQFRAKMKKSVEIMAMGRLCRGHILRLKSDMPFSQNRQKMAFSAMLEVWRRAEWV